MARKKTRLNQEAPDRLVKAKQPRPSLNEFLSDPAKAVAPEVELNLRPRRPDDSTREGKSLTAKELLALTREQGAVLTEADARAIEELKKL